MFFFSWIHNFSLIFVFMQEFHINQHPPLFIVVFYYFHLTSPVDAFSLFLSLFSVSFIHNFHLLLCYSCSSLIVGYSTFSFVYRVVSLFHLTLPALEILPLFLFFFRVFFNSQLFTYSFIVHASVHHYSTFTCVVRVVSLFHLTLPAHEIISCFLPFPCFLHTTFNLFCCQSSSSFTLLNIHHCLSCYFNIPRNLTSLWDHPLLRSFFQYLRAVLEWSMCVFHCLGALCSHRAL